MLSYRAYNVSDSAETTKSKVVHLIQLNYGHGIYIYMYSVYNACILFFTALNFNANRKKLPRIASQLVVMRLREYHIFVYILFGIP